MNKLLLKSVREYKKQSILAPFFVLLEVLMEVMIPMEMAKIIDIGIAKGNLPYIIQRGLILVVMAMLALYFGVVAGRMALWRRQATQRICATIYSTGYRSFPLRILTISLRPALLPV